MIRPSRPDDLDALYEICLMTGALGEDATGLVQDERLLGDLFVAPYAVLEPDLAFVLEDGEGVAGYVVGALETTAFAERLEAEWYPAVRARHPAGSGEGLQRLFTAYLHSGRRADPAVVAAYPSHLHIDLLPRAQGHGLGRRMMHTLYDALAARGSIGVHLDVGAGNARGVAFYRALAMAELGHDAMSHTFGQALPLSP